MKILTMEQGSQAWFDARLGVPSASLFGQIVNADGTKSKSRQKLLYQLAGEIITGQRVETYSNGHMTRGTEMEPEARAAYEFITGNDVVEVGFCLDDYGLFGCSPDGMVGEDGLLEIKCPSLPVAVEYLDKGKLPGAYHRQVHGQIMVTGRAWCDFMSYFPGLKPFIFRVDRDEETCDMIRYAVARFCSDLRDLVASIGR